MKNILLPCPGKLRSLLFFTIVLLSCLGSRFGYAQAGFTPLYFVGGSPQFITMCENTSHYNIDTLLEVNDHSSGDTDTWAAIVMPRGTLVASYHHAAAGGYLMPSGLSYTPPAGYSGHDTFSVRVVDQTGDTDMTTIYVTINPFPFVSTISGPASVCVGATINLTDTGSGGTWSSSTTSIATISSSGVVTGVAVGSDNITYIKTTACGSDTVRRTISVNPNAYPGSIAGVASLCAGGVTATFTDSVTGGSWSSTHTAYATVSSSGVVTTVGGGLDTIKYSVTNTCGTQSAYYVLNVISLPYAGHITGSTMVCTGSATHLSDTASGGTWSTTYTHITTVGTTGVVLGLSPGTDTIVYTVTNACGTVDAKFGITDYPAPYAGAIAGRDTVCPGAIVRFSDTLATGGVWSSIHTGIATVDSVGNITGVSAGTDTIVYTVTNSCGTVNAKHILFVLPLPPTGTITGDSSICLGGTVTLSDAITGGTWTSLHTSVATVSSSGDVTGTAVGLDTIIYNVASVYCTAGTRFPVKVVPLPTAGTITGSSNLCRGDSIILADTAIGGTWTSAYDTIASITAMGKVTGLALGTTTISYADTYACGATLATFSITVDTFPVVSIITGSADSVCPGDTILLNDTITSGVWSSLYPSIATVSGRRVIGVASGIDTIKYTVANACGSVVASYAVWVKSAAECTNSVQNVVNKQVGVSVFPNPNTGSFTISLPDIGANETVPVIVTNVVGEKVAEWKLTSRNTEKRLSIAPGIYYLFATLNGQRVVRKMVVE